MAYFVSTELKVVDLTDDKSLTIEDRKIGKQEFNTLSVIKIN